MTDRELLEALRRQQTELEQSLARINLELKALETRARNGSAPEFPPLPVGLSPGAPRCNARAFSSSLLPSSRPAARAGTPFRPRAQMARRDLRHPHPRPDLQPHPRPVSHGAWAGGTLRPERRGLPGPCRFRPAGAVTPLYRTAPRARSRRALRHARRGRHPGPRRPGTAFTGLVDLCSFSRRAKKLAGPRAFLPRPGLFQHGDQPGRSVQSRGRPSSRRSRRDLSPAPRLDRDGLCRAWPAPISPLDNGCSSIPAECSSMALAAACLSRPARFTSSRRGSFSAARP